MNTKEQLHESVRETKRNLILDAAWNVFSEKGFHDTRLEDIGESAGFSKASLYNYYTDKESILLNLGIREHQKFLQNIKEVINPNDNFVQSTKKILQTIYKIIGDNHTLILSYLPIHMKYLIHQCDTDEHTTLVKEIKSWEKDFENLMTELIKKGKDSGEIRSNIKTNIAVTYFTILSRNILLNFNKQTGNAEQEVDTLLHFLCKGLEINDPN